MKKYDLANKQYAYIWADGVYLRARMETEKNCILVIIGADENGKKEIVAINMECGHGGMKMGQK